MTISPPCRVIGQSVWIRVPRAVFNESASVSAVPTLKWGWALVEDGVLKAWVSE